MRAITGFRASIGAGRPATFVISTRILVTSIGNLRVFEFQTIIELVKAYAINYGLDLTTQVKVQFGSQPTPDSRYSTREQAAQDCVRLNRTRLHVGSHECAFVVDKLPDGGFGIICACHPH
jgi:hypothetical protein